MIDIRTGEPMKFNDGIHMFRPICPECESHKICFQRKITEEDYKNPRFKKYRCSKCGFKFS